MAISGNATTAYRLRRVNGEWVRYPTTSALKSACFPVREAIAAILRGECVLVAGDNVFAVKAAVEAAEAVQP